MTSLFERAWEAVCEQIGEERSRDTIVRVDVRTNKLTVELEDNGGNRWFSWTPNKTKELTPTRDKALPGAAEWHAEPAEVLAYRPGRRLVLRPASEPGTIVKLTRAGRAPSCAVSHRAAAATGAFVTAALQGHSETSLRFAYVHGRRLDIDPSGAQEFLGIGRALRRLQEAPASPELRDFLLEDELGVLITWSERVQRALGALPRGWEDVHAAALHTARSLPPAHLVTVHRDLHDKQFLMTEAGPALLDFDLVARGDAALDPGNLCAHLSLRALQGAGGCTPASAAEARANLLSGLGPVPAFFAQRLAFYEATTLLRLALVYSLRPRWSHAIEPLVESAGRSLLEVVA